MKTINIVDIVSSLPAQHTIYYRQRAISDSLTVVFHHTAVFKARIESIAKYHVQNQHYPGIGYHIVLNHDDRIYLTNYLNYISYHTGKNNSKTIGIAFNSNFDSVPPGPKFLNMAYEILLFLEKHYNIKNFTFHRDINKTDCPGKLFDTDKFRSNYNLFRSKVNLNDDFKFNIIKP